MGTERKESRRLGASRITLSASAPSGPWRAIESYLNGALVILFDDEAWPVFGPRNVIRLMTDHLKMMIMMQYLVRQGSDILGPLVVNVGELRDWEIHRFKRWRMGSKCQQQHHQSDGCSKKPTSRPS